MGVDVGCPDLILTMVSSGNESITHIFYLELKTRNGKLGESQIEWNKRFDAHPSSNATRAVAYEYDEAIDMINQWVASCGGHVSGDCHHAS